MNVSSASVEIASWEQSGIHVQAIQTHGSPGDFTVEVRQEGGAVQVRDRLALSRFFSSRSLLYIVSVPKSVITSVTTRSGQRTIFGSAGSTAVLWCMGKPTHF